MLFYHLVLRTKKSQRIDKKILDFFLNAYEHEVFVYNEFTIEELRKKINLVSLRPTFLQLDDFYYSIKLSVESSEDMKKFLDTMCRNHPEIITKLSFVYKDKYDLIKNAPLQAI